jgi:fumarate reductase iron-sulfur subunit
MSESELLHVEVWRGAAEGKFQSFDVPRREHQTVLDVVTQIQREQDATLSYRFACRDGMCGSCAMVVNGRPRWTCRTRVSEVTKANGQLQLEPLKNFAVVKDLAVEMTDFFDKNRDAKGYFEPQKSWQDPLAARIRNCPARKSARQAADAGIECIGCGGMLFGLRCGGVERGLSRAGGARPRLDLVNDVRDGGQDARLSAVSGSAGCHACHSHELHAICPKGIAPTCSIAGLKRAMVSRVAREAENVTAIIFAAGRNPAGVLHSR